MQQTLTGPTLTLWVARRHELDHLAMLRVARSAICGCTRCGDEDRGVELDRLIARSELLIAEINDKITDGSAIMKTRPHREDTRHGL